MAAVGQEFWIVAAGCSKTGTLQQEKQKLLDNLKGNAAVGSSLDGPWLMDVPDGDRALVFGSFDNLIKLTDDLQKADSQLDGIVHRLERQYLELDPKAEFVVKSQRQSKSFKEYLTNWQWDEAKLHRTRSISDNLGLLLQVVSKLDEETRIKAAAYNDVKTQKANISKKEGVPLQSRDLVDVLTPQVVTSGNRADADFIYTEHLTTVCVILPRGTEPEFLKCYESLCDNIVPMSAKQFAIDDKDGNTLWRVVMFKSACEAFKKGCRERRFIPRDFEYSEEGFKKLEVQRESVDENLKKQHERVKGLYQAAWSDTMVAWIHIKAMRVFVESVLRFGMPPRFATFIIQPTSSTANLRKALAEILGKGSTAVGPSPAEKMAETAGEDGDEFFPYVSLAFTPFNTARG